MIVKKGVLSESEAAKILKQIFSAVQYMHDNNIVHKDLNPDNILMDKNDIETVKLIDFGNSLMKKPAHWF